jgi:hypothetical protein
LSQSTWGMACSSISAIQLLKRMTPSVLRGQDAHSDASGQPFR